MKKKILLCQLHDNCKCSYSLLKKEFEINLHTSTESFFKALKESNSDAAVVCLNSEKSLKGEDHHFENQVRELTKFESFSGFMPLLSCTKGLNENFIHQAVDKGIRRFLSSDMEIEKITFLINDAIKQNELKKFIETKFPGCFERSSFAKKIIDEIVRKFPKRIYSDEMATKLKITERWLQHQSKKAFGISYKKLFKLIRVFHALRLMEKGDMDNNEISLQLNYTEESNMARDFRIVIGIPPNEARKKLSSNSSSQLIKLKPEIDLNIERSAGESF
jgi:AraC-like DNA-binding protein